MRLYIITAVCILSLLCAGMSQPVKHGTNFSDDKSATAEAVAAENNTAAQDDSGPVVGISYSQTSYNKNPTADFMYFIPLISPVSVVIETSADNNQQGGGISYTKTEERGSFYAACGFKMEGKGSQKYIFDSEEMIARNAVGLSGNEPMPYILDWIRFEGEGTGLFEVSGTVDDNNQTVTEVVVNFSAGDEQSPVTVGLYRVRPKDGKYEYSNKYNGVIARVEKLTFKRSEGEPKMAIKISSLRRETAQENFGSSFKAFIVNFLIKPLEIARLGNDTMLRLGQAITDKQEVFCFPKAMNIKETKTVPAPQGEK